MIQGFAIMRTPKLLCFPILWAQRFHLILYPGFIELTSYKIVDHNN